MSSVDNRTVAMTFDNAAFEQKIAGTIKSLDQLQKTLDFTNSQKGLTELGSAAKSFNMDGLTSAAEGVSAKFLAMATIGITALSNITNRAVDAGIQMAKSLSIKPIMSGFQEYELGMKSIQTILANTRADNTNLEQVNGALDQLNQYADKTIYNFGEMTRNIGTFTAAGVNLDTSVQSIKGIANLAAISGSTSEQASSAMYQLSQAVSTGTLRLMDWNSVVNAGMGGEVFQKALFETGKAMKTIQGVDMNTTFEEWTAGGNSFRSSLEKGWLTGEVLTNTLSGFTGEMTEAQLLSIGYTKQQVAEIIELGKVGVEAATKVRTFSQLVDTTKEAIGSGWSQSFRTIFGDFEQATELFTGISNAIGGIVGSSADARNELLGLWSYVGGRETLITGLKDAFKTLSSVLGAVTKGFRNVFPPMTAEKLVELTNKFAAFTESLKPGHRTLAAIQRISRAVFQVFDIGIEVIKGVFGVFKDLFSSVSVGENGFFKFSLTISEFVQHLHDVLVTGGGIKEFFENISTKAAALVTRIREVISTFIDMVTGFKDGATDAVGGSVERMTTRFAGLKNMVAKIKDLWGPFSEKMQAVGGILDKTWEVIKAWFKDLGRHIAEAFGPGDFDAALDVLNVGLLGGITLMIKKFMSGGLNVNIGDNFFDKVGGIFDSLTGKMKAMQTDIKANALLKIAGAIALLTASVVVLSMIDSDALAKALTAMSVGFGELLASFAVISKMASAPKSAASFSVIAGGLIMLSVAILILSAAVKIMASMSWEELARGLTGITVLLGVLTGAAILLSKHSGGLILTGVGLMAVAVAIAILAGAMKIFTTMSWEELGKGFAGVAGGLLIIAAAMNLMPVSMVVTSLGLVAVAVALNLLALAVLEFSLMSWEDIGKGLAGIAGGLLIIAAAMNLMPLSMIVTSVGVLAVAVAMNVLAGAILIFSTMSWEELGRGLAGLAGAMLILSLAMLAMTGTIGGAIALVIVSAALMGLAKALTAFSKIGFGDLFKTLAGIVAAVVALSLASAILTLAAPLFMIAGAALLIFGAGLIVVATGALIFAKALEVMSKASKGALEMVIAIIDAVIIKVPQMLKAFAQGIVELVQVFLGAAPMLLEQLGAVLVQLFTTITEVAPKLGEALVAVILTLLSAIGTVMPELIATGLALLVSFLSGLAENIGTIATSIIQIIVGFLTAVAEQMPSIITAAVGVFVAFLTGLTSNIDQIVTAGAKFIVALLEGIAKNIGPIGIAATDVIVAFITSIGENLPKIVTAAADVVVAFITSMGENADKIITAATDLIVTLVTGIGASAGRVVTAATDTIVAFVGQLSASMWRITTAAAAMIAEFIRTIGANASRIVTAGVDTVIEFVKGLSNNALKLARAAFDILTDFLNALAEVIRKKSPELREAGVNIAGAIIDGMTGGLASKAKSVASSAVDVAKGALGAVAGALGIRSPSKRFYEFGEFMAQGMALALDSDKTASTSAVAMADRVRTSFQSAIGRITDILGASNEFNPTITPVLDLTQARIDAQRFNGILGGSSFSPSVSYSQASSIASTSRASDIQDSADPTTGRDIVFQQTIHAPTKLSTGDIYRQTRNQIVLAKEALSIA